MLHVTSPNAKLTFSTLGAGRSAGLLLAAPKDTPKSERSAQRQRGRVDADALWDCALTSVEAEKTERHEQRTEQRDLRQEEREERAEVRAERAERNAAQAAALADFMGQMNSGGSSLSAFDENSEGSEGSEGSFTGSCCVNGAFYDCPSAEAVTRCTGAFMRCQSGCGMDFDCIEGCARSHPADPSMCSRDMGSDNQCRN